VGFALCRIARAAAPRNATRLSTGWRRPGATWRLAGPKPGQTLNPDLVLPRPSVVVLAMNYWQGDDESRVGVKSRVPPINRG